ncbi:MAG: hypothetical protein II660_03545 [Bacteroidales bacterium]|nr:hypothetical protein [Bacteroidales bacterium]
MGRWEHLDRENAPGGSLDENVGAGWRVKALGGRTLDVERFTEGARRRVLDGGALDEGALDGGALNGRALDGGALDGGALNGGALDGGALDGGALDGGVLDGRGAG